METMLKVSDLYVSYGHIEALRGVSVEVKKGQIVSIIGANGAGKSTLLRTISGLVKPKSGGVEFEGEVLPKKPSKIVGKGVVHVPEGRKCFSGLTIQDNLLVGGYLFKGKRLEEDLKEQYDRFPILEQRKNQFAGTLSGGEQQMLAVARGLMSRPKILLLDEPSMGLAPIIVNQIYDLIKQIRDSGITVLLVEQNARKALGICDYAYVLENGKINIDHQLQRKRNMEYIIEATKTDSGTRMVPMTEEVQECFRFIITNRKKPKKDPVIYDKNRVSYKGFLYLDKNDMPMVALHWEKYFQHICEKYNKIYKEELPKITPHVCRHTFCSNMAKSGMNPKTLQKIMGHSDIGVTLNTYTHLDFEDIQKEMKQVCDSEL